MTPKQERHMVASIGTFLFMGLVFLLLWLLELTTAKPQEQDYVEVTMMEDFEEIQEPEIPKVKPDPAPSQEKDPGAASPAPVTPTPPNNQPTKTSTEQIVSEEEQLAIIQQRKADSIAEVNRKKQKEIEDFMGGFDFSVKDDNGTAPNQTAPDGPGTAPKGSGASGKDWTLDGRGLVGALPQPTGDFNKEGTVVVQITVDASGKVIEAIVVGGNISEKEIRQLAIDAAYKAKFTSSKNVKQVGKITYKFKVN